MSDETAAGLGRAEREIQAARSLVRDGFAAQAVSRAYYACLYSAEMALLALGETRSKHSGVISAFSRLVVKEMGFDQDVARILRSRFEDRNEADYEFGEPDADDAKQAIDEAERFVAEVKQWLESR